MNITLVQTPWWTPDTPPISIASLIGPLLSKNHKLTVFDFNIELYNNNKNNLLGYLIKVSYSVSLKDLINILNKNNLTENNQMLYYLDKVVNSWVKKILDSTPHILGISLTRLESLFVSLLLVKKIKSLNPNIKIVFGGVFILRSKDIFKLINPKWVDYIVVTNNVESFLNLIEAIKGNINIEDCKGIYYKKGSKYVFSGSDISLGFKETYNLNFDFFDLKKYKYPKMIPMLWSRGCKGKCNFCIHPKISSYWEKSPERIVQEMKYYINKYGVHLFWINDSTINWSHKRLSKICDFILKENLNVLWGGFARLSERLDRSLLKKMYLSGCRFLQLGVESGSDRILSIMNKSYRKRSLNKILNFIHKSRINTIVYYIVGYPGEKEKDFYYSLISLLKNQNYINSFAIQRFHLEARSDLYASLSSEEHYFLTNKQIKHYKMFGNCYYSNNSYTLGKTRLLREVAYDLFDIHKIRFSEDIFFKRPELFPHLDVEKPHIRKKSEIPKSFQNLNAISIKFPLVLENTYFSSTDELKLSEKLEDSKMVYKRLIPSETNINLLFLELKRKKPKKLFLSFKFTQSLLNKKTGTRIINLLRSLRDKGIPYRVLKPLPRCLFGYNYKNLISDYSIPEDCSACMEYLSFKDDKIEYCFRNFDIKLNRSFIDSQQCKRCIYLKRKMCFGRCC